MVSGQGSPCGRVRGAWLTAPGAGAAGLAQSCQLGFSLPSWPRAGGEDREGAISSPGRKAGCSAVSPGVGREAYPGMRSPFTNPLT